MAEKGRPEKGQLQEMTEEEIKGYLLAAVSSFGFYIPARVIKVSAFELAYQTINPPLAEADNTDGFLRKVFRDEAVHSLLEQLVSEGKIKKSTEAKEARFYIGDK